MNGWEAEAAASNRAMSNPARLSGGCDDTESSDITVKLSAPTANGGSSRESSDKRASSNATWASNKAQDAAPLLTGRLLQVTGKYHGSCTDTATEYEIMNVFAGIWSKLNQWTRPRLPVMPAPVDRTPWFNVPGTA